MGWIPEVPTIRRENGKDGKKRLYLVARNEVDIELMLTAAGLSPTGVHEQNNESLQGYYRIIRSWEEKLLKNVFP